jgi:cullin-associated NEDD8-dissociated protein 1
VTAFQSPNEETKSAASHALGSLAVGAIHKYLPYILQQIEAQVQQLHPCTSWSRSDLGWPWSLQTEHRYLYLQALRQLISLKALEGAGSSDSLQGRVGNVMALLITQCDAEEEGVRSMVSECLGRLALIAPAAVLPQLQASAPLAVAGTFRFPFGHRGRDLIVDWPCR